MPGSVASGTHCRSQQGALFLNFILTCNSTCFGQTYCPSSGVLLLSTARILDIVFTETGNCHNIYVDCLRGGDGFELSSISTSLADSQHK